MWGFLVKGLTIKDFPSKIVRYLTIGGICERVGGMSAGTFEVGLYEDQNGNTWECRVQPETKGLTLNTVANAYAAGPATAGLPTLPVKILSRRGFGITMRSVTVELTADGTGETAGYQGTGTRFTVPVFDEAVWSGYDKGQTGTYLGIACVFRSKSPESIR